METVRINEFIKSLCGDKYKECEDCLYDGLVPDDELNRVSAARIIHAFIQKALKEDDVKDINPAAVLRDLYDCRSCVNHIAQVYLKGIMTHVSVHGLENSKGEDFIIFDGKSLVDKKSAQEMILRAFNRDKRLNPS
ncbi:MAG: hypothetical protein K5669_04955 [Lachnospiraceae bacterium]|nr:hypothetical protein [Lachnospiraceae bacterium]